MRDFFLGAAAIYFAGAICMSVIVTAVYFQARREGLAERDALGFSELAAAILLWPVILVLSLMD
jgi:hypothetical protein